MFLNPELFWIPSDCREPFRIRKLAFPGLAILDLPLFIFRVSWLICRLFRHPNRKQSVSLSIARISFAITTGDVKRPLDNPMEFNYIEFNIIIRL